VAKIQKAVGVYRNGAIKLEGEVELDEGESVELIILRKGGGVSTSTLYIEHEKGGEKIITQGVCLVESLPSKLSSIELKDAVESLFSPAAPPLMDPGLGRLELYRMILDKLGGDKARSGK